MLEFSCLAVVVRTRFFLGTSVLVGYMFFQNPPLHHPLKKRKRLGVFRLLHEILVRNFCVVREGFAVVPQAGVNRIIPII